MKKLNFLIKRIAIILVVTFMLFQIETVIGQNNPKPPYPIIFVHGWYGNDESFEDWIDFFDDNNFGWVNGGTIDVCLDNINETLMDPVGDAEVNLVTQSINEADYYFINFHYNDNGDSHPDNDFLTLPILNTNEFIDIIIHEHWPIIGGNDDIHAGDILAIREEFCKVLAVNDNTVSIQRNQFESVAVWQWGDPYVRVRIISNNSNQSSIVKTGYGLKKAIDLVTTTNSCEKVILVCHSMGGLTAREYVQGDYFDEENPDVALIATYSTPHMGSNKSDTDDLANYFGLNFDLRSDAVRDLRYRVEKEELGPPSDEDNAPYLFGGLENHPDWDPDFKWYSLDVNSNGNIGDNVIGLNTKIWPDIPLHCVIGEHFIPLPDYPFWISTGDDGIVRTDRQYPSDGIVPNNRLEIFTFELYGAPFPLYKAHMRTHKQFPDVMIALDEPDEIDLAYKLFPNNSYHGFITDQADQAELDDDWYKFESDVSGNIEIELTGCNPDYWALEIWDENENYVIGLTHNSGLNTVLISNVTEGDLFYIWVYSQVYPDSWTNPYTLSISTTYTPVSIPYLTLGTVDPTSGTTDDNFEFSVTYIDPTGSAPNSVTLYGENWDYSMTANGNNYEEGVEYLKTLSFSTPGIIEYYYEAETNNGDIVRYPESGYLELNIIESVAGWEVDVAEVDASPNYLENGGITNVSASVHNNSNSPDKIYIDLSYTFQLFSPSGNLLETETGTIPTINQSQTVNVNKSFNLGGTNGVYTINFSVNPTKDNNPANNSGSDVVIVGQEGPSHQFYIDGDEAWVALGNSPYPNCHSFNGDNYCVTYISSSSIQVTQNGGSPKTINNHDFREFNSGQVALIVEGINTVGNNYVFISFGVQNPNYVSFEQTEISCFRGDEICFEANCSSNTFTGDTPDFYKNSYIDDWFSDVDLSNGNHTAMYKFNIPNDASYGEHEFFIGCDLAGANEKFLRELKINVIEQPPNIVSLSSYSFSADDLITISGNNFMNSGIVKFGTVPANTINNWTNSSIICIVPEGIQNAGVYVITNSGTSNGVSYQVISSTGDPEVIQPVPDQSMNGGSTLLAADFNNVFWDPNGDDLTYDVQYSSSNLTHNSDFATTGLLYLTAAENASETIPVTISATDDDNVTVTDDFNIQIIMNIPPLAADFTADVTYIILGESVQFSDLSTGEPTSWQWDFENDGTIDSEEQSPEEWIYTEPGTYSVSLTVSDGTNQDTEIKEDYIIVLDEGLVAYYPFNGNANDESGNGNDGTVNGATPATDRFGNTNSAYEFDGIDDYILIDDSPSQTLSEELSISAFINLEDINNYKVIVAKFHHQTNNREYQFSVSSEGQLRFYWSANGDPEQQAFYFGNSILQIDSWYHVVIVFSNGNLKFYINNQLDFEVTSSINSIFDSDSKLSIGSDYHQNLYYFNGLLDDIRIYNRALSEIEIQELYNWSPLIADFTANSLQVNLGATVSFTDLSAGDPISWQWDFENDGIVDSEEQNPEWIYTEPGTYSVSLTVSDGINTETEIKDDYIIVENTTWQCGDPYTDLRDEQSYNTVQIGDQCWMAENLNYETSNSWCYNNDPENCIVYGKLYDWNAAMGACPAGWHLPSDDEFCTMTTVIDPTVNCNSTGYIGTDAGGKMKTTGTLQGGDGLWNEPNTGATNESGFSGLPAGGYGNGSFGNLSYGAAFWCSSVNGSTRWRWEMVYEEARVNRNNYYNPVYGYSVRCLKDETINQPPDPPSSPNPEDGAENQSIEIDLSWTCSDPEGDPLTYDIYFGTEATPPLVSTGQTETTYDPGTLEINTEYFWKIVAHDDHSNTTEGAVWNFITETEGHQPCPGIPTVTYEGQVYNTILIGGQCWLKENLNVGTMINGSQNMSPDGIIEKYCYDNNPANCDEYGGLYQWDEMMQYVTTQGVQGICPAGWYIPTNDEWKILEGAVDSQYPVGDPIWNSPGWRGYDAGLNLKSTNGWYSRDNGTDLYGFTTLPGGYRRADGNFSSLTNVTIFLTSSEANASSAWRRGMDYNHDGVDLDFSNKSYGFSVRCLKDENIQTITTEANPPEGGTTTGDGVYSIGTEVTVTATPNTEWEFINWTEDGVEVSVDPVYTFFVSGDVTLVANFEYFPIYYIVTTGANPPEGGTTAGDGTYEEGTQVTVNAYPNTDWEFINWTVDGEEISILPEYTFNLECDIHLVSNFEYPPPQFGTISGIVTELETGNPIEGALVVVEGTELSELTGSDGTYSIEDVAVGVYSVTASANGYYSLTIQDQEVISNQTTIVNFSLTPEGTFPHFPFEPGNPADPVWSIYLSESTLDELDLLNNRKELITINMNQACKLLPEEQFFRISRFNIINLNFLRKVERKNHQCTMMADGEKIILKGTLQNLKQLEKEYFD